MAASEKEVRNKSASAENFWFIYPSFALYDLSAISCPLQVISFLISCQHPKPIILQWNRFFFFQNYLLVLLIQSEDLWGIFGLSFLFLHFVADRMLFRLKSLLLFRLKSLWIWTIEILFQLFSQTLAFLTTDIAKANKFKF